MVREATYLVEVNLDERLLIEKAMHSCGDAKLAAELNDRFRPIPPKGEPKPASSRRGAPATSKAAAESVNTAQQIEEILAFARQRGMQGITADEATERFDDWGTSSAAARIADLKNAGRLVPNGNTRPTRKGRQAEVLVWRAFLPEAEPTHVPLF